LGEKWVQGETRGKPAQTATGAWEGTPWLQVNCEEAHGVHLYGADRISQKLGVNAKEGKGGFCKNGARGVQLGAAEVKEKNRNSCGKKKGSRGP